MKLGDIELNDFVSAIDEPLVNAKLYFVRLHTDVDICSPCPFNSSNGGCDKNGAAEHCTGVILVPLSHYIAMKLKGTP